MNKVTFWGVRGSIAAPGPRTARVGGNTSCIEVQLGGERFILDGGTGLRQLGLALGSRPLRAQLLFGHLHWDHIQGVPFFAPLFHPQSELLLLGPEGLHATLCAQMSGPTFPLALEQLPARKRFYELVAGEHLSLGPVKLRSAALRHPGGGLAYRLEADGCAVVYACDTEHPEQGVDEGLLQLAQGAQLLIYDAQYLPEEYPSKRGWGHSTFVQGAALARAAGVEQLVLCHHDPARDDLAVARLERQARQLFAASWAAREGGQIQLARGAPPAQRSLAASQGSA